MDADIYAFLNSLDEGPLNLIGWGGGGSTSYSFWLQYPEKVNYVILLWVYSAFYEFK